MITIRTEAGRTYITHTGEDFDGAFNREYRTDSEGNGLWIWKQAATEWKQLIGAAQINLRGDRSTIRRRFERAVGFTE